MYVEIYIPIVMFTYFSAANIVHIQGIEVVPALNSCEAPGFVAFLTALQYLSAKSMMLLSTTSMSDLRSMRSIR